MTVSMRTLMAAGVVVGVAGAAMATPRVPTTINDFYFHGTQPGMITEPMVDPQTCGLCHSDYSGQSPDKYTLPYGRWVQSMMAQAYRDPVFHAGMDIATKDALGSNDMCIKCHAPAGWAQNRGPTRPIGNPQPFEFNDTTGVSCSVCHRMVDPVEQAVSPLAGTPGQYTSTTDRDILVALGVHRPPNFPNGGPVGANHYVLDPEDRRRGPNDLGTLAYHDWLQTDLHRKSRLCASCHEVSNPAFVRMPDGSYGITPLGQPHPTGNKYDMFPIERTYSEWLASSFATAPVTLTVPDPNGGPDPVGRYSFDGVTETDDGFGLVVFNASTSYATCQDCHQPQSEGPGCALGVAPRPVPVHNFAGANSWVMRAIFDLFGPDTGMTELSQIEEAVKRNWAMLRKAADLTATRAGSEIVARVINQTGHKLPTSYPEGRRMWLNVRFYDANQTLIAERGAYDLSSATLTEGDTKVYHVEQGLDTNVAAYLAQRAIDLGDPTLALPVGHSFHMTMNNKIYFDNRIPPRGYSQAGFAAVQAEAVNYPYADGQYWDDTTFVIPAGAKSAEIRLFHQTTTRQYAEFLRDNATSVSDFVPQPVPAPPVPLSIGQIVYDQWVKWGKSEPVEMALAWIDLSACNLADISEIGGTSEAPGSPDGQLTVDDIIVFVNLFSDGVGCPGSAPCNKADVTGIGGPPEAADGQLTVDDIIAFFNAFSDGC